MDGLEPDADTLLHVLLQYPYFESIRMLLQYGANPNIMVGGNSARVTAILHYKYFAGIEIFLNAGVELYQEATKKLTYMTGAILRSEHLMLKFYIGCAARQGLWRMQLPHILENAAPLVGSVALTYFEDIAENPK
ncbi:hypothetical protein F5B20DRAFT_575575 [Whalleya microplaca]|nr:hypothetical protein F5B20DRAFT_575575 [Whalleya microplaca]